MKISRDELCEFVGQIIDVFEDYLEENDVHILNEDRQKAIETGEDSDCLAILYGSDYDKLAEGIEEILVNWKAVEPYGV